MSAIIDEVLEILAQNRQKPISGESIAVRLRISRNAVWKAVNTLKKQGFYITASTNSGYCLYDDIVTRKGMQNCGFGSEVRIFHSLSSTNDYLKAEAEKSKEGLVVIARNQTQGRGRMGRKFFSPPNTGLYISILLKPKMQAEEAVKITTMAGVAVCRAIESLSDKKAQIKWVNDVFVSGKKVCGILTEASVNVENGGMNYAVLGIGVNLYEPLDGFSEELRDIAGAVFQLGAESYADRFACELLRQFFLLYNGQSYIEEYKERSLLTGREITYMMQGKEKRAIVLGIDDHFGLIVKDDAGNREILRSGEVRVKYDKNQNKND